MVTKKRGGAEVRVFEAPAQPAQKAPPADTARVETFEHPAAEPEPDAEPKPSRRSKPAATDDVDVP